MSRGTKFIVTVVAIMLLVVGGYAVIGWVNAKVAEFEKLAQAPGQTAAQMATQVAQTLHPTPTILSSASVVMRIQSVARLETVTVEAERVIVAESNQGPFAFLFGEKLIFVAHGQVWAGVDLGKLQPGDIQVVSATSVVIRLPAAEVLVSKLDNQKSYVYNHDAGIFRGVGDINLESTARLAAETQITDQAVQDGLLLTARTNAENIVRNLANQMGFTEVTFLEPLPPTPTPSP